MYIKQVRLQKNMSFKGAVNQCNTSVLFLYKYPFPFLHSSLSSPLNNLVGSTFSSATLQVTIQGFKSYRNQTICDPFSPQHNVIGMNKLTYTMLSSESLPL